VRRILAPIPNNILNGRRVTKLLGRKNHEVPAIRKPLRMIAFLAFIFAERALPGRRKSVNTRKTTVMRRLTVPLLRLKSSIINGKTGGTAKRFKATPK